MENKPLVSVIVPVYKAEAFLDKCMESLLGQSYSKLEIILVDDGSPDRCPQLCESWSKKDARIRVLHKENSGAADARNCGAAAASGDYISFVDADDFISADYVQYLLSLLTDTGGDIACGSIRLVDYPDASCFDEGREDRVIAFDRLTAYRALCLEYYMPLVAPVAKLFPAAMIKGIPFPAGRLHEDEATMYKLYFEAEKTVLGTREIYAYYQNPGSVTHNKTRRHMQAVVLAFCEQCDFFRDKGCAELQKIAVERLLSFLVDLADRGDEVCKEFLAQKRERPYLISGLGIKPLMRYYGYRLFKTDLNKLYHKILGK